MRTVTKKRMAVTRREFLEIAAGASIAAAFPSLLFAEKAKGVVLLRTLGRTGEKVSAIGLGGYHIGDPKVTESDSISIIRKAIDNGINFLDNCWDYNDGQSEIRMGKALRDGYRQKAFLMTKIDGRTKQSAASQINESLRRLQTDHVDVLQIHRPDPETDVEETLSALTDLIRAGKVRVIGSSTMPASDIVDAQWVAERRGLERFRMEQPPYSILSRGIEAEVLPVAERFGMGVVVYSPLAQGMLTGRVRKGQETDLRRAALVKHLSDERRIDTVEQLIPLAEEAGLKMTHMAMAFAIAHPGVTSALIGPRTMEQLEDTLAGAEVTLSDELLDRIDEIVPPGTDVGTLDQAYRPPALLRPSLRRRPVEQRQAGAVSWR